MQADCWKPEIRLCVAIWLGSILAWSPVSAATGLQENVGAASKPVDFWHQIQPILSNNCFECHGGVKQKGGLRLDDKSTALKGGDSGPALVPEGVRKVC